MLPGISIEMKSYSVNFVAYSFIEICFSRKVHICNYSNQVHIGSIKNPAGNQGSILANLFLKIYVNLK